MTVQVFSLCNDCSCFLKVTKTQAKIVMGHRHVNIATGCALLIVFGLKQSSYEPLIVMISRDTILSNIWKGSYAIIPKK